MFFVFAAPNTTANDGSYWWLYPIVIALTLIALCSGYVQKIKKKK
jgi:hypothetical protein